MHSKSTPLLSVILGTTIMIAGSAMAETPTLPSAAATLSPEELKPLIETYDGEQPLHKLKDESGKTVGHHAALNLDHPDIALLLIELGVEIRGVDYEGYTPLAIGVLNDNVYFVWHVTQKTTGWIEDESSENSGRNLCDRGAISNPSCSVMLQRYRK